MHGPKERPRADSVAAELADGFLGIEKKFICQDHAINPVDVLGVIRAAEGQLNFRELSKLLCVPGPHPPLTCHEFVKAFQLRDAKCGLQIGHAKVPAKLLMHEPLFPLKAKISQAAAFIRQFLIVRDDHAAFACGDVLVRIKAKCADVTKTAAGATHVGLPMHFSGVFDRPDPMLGGEFENGGNIDWQSKDVDKHDDFGPAGNAPLDIIYVHVPSPRITVHEYW